MIRRLIILLLIVGCYRLIEYNPKYNSDINALQPYKDCQFECEDSSDVHCHWNKKTYSNEYVSGLYDDPDHAWITDKCNFDLCICMLECISENYRPATKAEAIQYCYIGDTLWAEDGKADIIFDYDIWEQDYLNREK